MELNCHTQNAQSIVITLAKLMVLNCHTQNAQPIVITLTKLMVMIELSHSGPNSLKALNCHIA